jgi:hypothetical protein
VEGGHEENMVEGGGRKGVTEKIWWRMVGGRWSRREYGAGWWEEGGHGEYMVEDGGRQGVAERI